MRPFKHKVQYYETDMMGVTHHANYIHWMEEARIDFLEQLGFPYAAMEQQGVLCPVKSVFCDYKHTSTFDDEIEIRIWVESFTGLRMTIQYEMVNQEGTVVCTARSEHFPRALRRTPLCTYLKAEKAAASSCGSFFMACFMP